MTLSLWCGARMLGSLQKQAPGPDEAPQRPGEPPQLSAILIPAADGAPLEGVWQVALPPQAGIGVQQHPLAVFDTADLMRHASERRGAPSAVELRPMSRQEILGVPAEQQYTVHDEGGGVHLPLQLRLQEWRYALERLDELRLHYLLEAVVGDSVWLAFIVFAPMTIDFTE